MPTQQAPLDLIEKALDLAKSKHGFGCHCGDCLAVRRALNAIPVVREQIATLTRQLEQAQEALKPYRWRPLSEIHEDFGPCVLMNIEDPGTLGVFSAVDTDLEGSVAHWGFTHFAEVPKLTCEDADELRAIAKATKEAK